MDGALALAVPTRYGQSMLVRKVDSSERHLQWRSYDSKGKSWFEARFYLPSLQIAKTNSSVAAKRLQQIFSAIDRQRPDFWTSYKSLQIETRLEFPRLWGLGTSSTLLVNLGRWSQTDPFRLLNDSFTGSGYDIACGLSNQALFYQLRKGRPHFVNFPYRPSFAGSLYFVYLEAKQDSRTGIVRYREKVKQADFFLDRISELSLSFLQASNLKAFESCMESHEQFVAQALQLPIVKERLFSDYWGQVKSLGAWGGDFVMATSDRPIKETRQYFNEKGYSVVLAYEELLL